MKAVKTGRQWCRDKRNKYVVRETTGFGEREGEDGHLSSFRLVLYILCGADLGPDVLKVGQRLVDDAELLGRGCR